MDRETFEARRAAGGFLESAEFFGHLYGTPIPDPPPGKDVVLEIDLQGARQVIQSNPDVLLVLLLPPSVEQQTERLRGRGDEEEEVVRRIAKGIEEERLGRSLTRHVVVNSDRDQAVAQVAGILEGHRKQRGDLPTGADLVGDPDDGRGG